MSDRNTPDDETRLNPQRAGQPPASRIGRFDIVQVLGEGAFGRVYRAFDPQLARQVAIKVPHREGLTPEFRDRFLREARATATIHHPNVCPVYDVGTDGDLPYIVMRYVVGTTLASLLERLRGPLPPRHALAIARKLALGVTAAHAKGVVHRDLKPANVLYDEANREVLITDFGLALMTTDARMTVDGAVMGTPAYMSPEQARGRRAEIGPLSDVYSLGVIFYRLLTGSVPFTGSVYEVLVMHAEAAPQFPSVRSPGLDPRLDAICLRAMAKRPADRYPSAKAFADALAGYLRDDERTESEAELPFAATLLPEEAAQRRALPPAPKPQPATAAPTKRRRGRVLALAFVLLLAGAGAGWLFRADLERMFAPPAEQTVAEVPPAAAPAPAPSPAEQTLEVAPPPRRKFDAKKLVGKWERPITTKKAADKEAILTWEFTAEKLLISTSVAAASPTPRSYTLEGDKLSYEVKNVITYTVLNLTDNELELQSATGVLSKFKKVKPKP